MKRLFFIMSVLLLLPLCAFAVTSVPEGVTDVEAEAFAGTAIDGLIVPSTVQTVGADVLAGCNASYLYLQGVDTTLAEGANRDVPFIFAPAASSASGLSGFYASETLCMSGGLYYSVTDTALPLCAQTPFRLAGGVTIPKLLDGVPVTSLEVLDLSNTGVTLLRVPQYLSIPEDMHAETYPAMTVTAPVPDAEDVTAGATVTWTTSVEGAYGDVSYLWRFEMNGETTDQITASPEVALALTAAGECTVTVTAIDALCDEAVSTASTPVNVTAAAPVYRALLIGNTYPGEPIQLAGCDTDVAAMNIVLGLMSGTSYQVTTVANASASRMRTSIASAFSGAAANDVSLFYYSGHGGSSGSLVGTGSTHLSVYELRTALDSIPGTKIVILDCCYSGSFIGRSARSSEAASSDLSAFNSAVISAFSSSSRSATNLADDGFIVLTACRSTQESSTVTDYYSGINFGAFTYGLCYGSGYDSWNSELLGSMPADTNGNGAITLDEALRVIRERVGYLNALMGGALEQQVQYYGSDNFILWRK